MISGIYILTNTQTGLSYVGQSIDLKQRKRSHLSDLRLGKHCNQHFQRSFWKYGESAFKYQVLEVGVVPELLDGLEQYWMDLIGKENLYNFLPTAGSTRGIKQSPETIEKRRPHLIGRIFSAEHRARISEAARGRKHTDAAKAKMSMRVYSDETRRKMSESAKKRMHRPLSEATKAKISAAHRGRTLRKHTPEESLAKSLRQAGKRHALPRTAEQRARMSAARKGKGLGPKSEQHLTNIRNSIAERKGSMKRLRLAHA